MGLERHSLPGSLASKLQNDLAVKSAGSSSALHNLSLGSATSALHNSLSHHMHLPPTSSQQSRLSNSTGTHTSSAHTGSTTNTSSSNGHTTSHGNNLYSPSALAAQSNLSHSQLSGSAFGTQKYEHLLSSSNSLSNGLTPTSSASSNYHAHHLHHHHHHAAAAAAHHAASAAHHHHHHSPSLSQHVANSASSGGSLGGYSVKSESNATNYDYVNNCYFGSSFGGLGGSAGSSAGVHGTTASDMGVYHHQHNVIQAAKLMATS